ncbi:hypothetical protein D9757_012014 [Collybiopsis confluens]|uniref:Phosducin thioredoxin-like domain-containing protein n=1 Tax=Collybiopsis confluens TaxID=2823264 RepID=A0A8H5LU91_9AGAR|nr:hypothetical protein D9757_012672 [Collybiopsis confluens]KAF5370265.1 hypothetical protein D9757_012014 [Collybiopsis confluens]
MNNNGSISPLTTASSSQAQAKESIRMGPGRTGVKGVIRDRDKAEEINRLKQHAEMDEVRKRMEKSSLGGKTFLEEERAKGPGEKVDELVLRKREREKERENERRDVFGRPREGKFGHLREMDVFNYLSAVEKEENGVWVVVHLCFILDNTLAHLARIYLDTKFLRCRAAALGFASTNKTKSKKPKSSSPLGINRPSRLIWNSGGDDSDDEDDEDDREDGDPYEEDNVDFDMLPTVLVYRDGELVHNWVRVDWEAGDAGVEELLEKHQILPKPRTFFGQFSVPSDGEDGDSEGLIWSDDDS